jgi:hypothetical protein
MDEKAKSKLALLVVGGSPEMKKASSSEDTEPKKDEDEESYDPEHLEMISAGMKELGAALSSKDYDEAAKVFMRCVTMCDED